MKETESVEVNTMFDGHVHFRQDDLMSAVASYTFEKCSGAIIMPNTKPIISSTELAREYKKEICLLSKKVTDFFFPFLTIYLTNNTDIEDLEMGYENDIFIAGKLYPAGATTNAGNWVTNIENIYPVFEKMQDIGMPLLMHCEKVDSTIDFFDRERVFIKEIMPSLVAEFPDLTVVVEHVSTKEGVEFVVQNKNVWATVTPHHLMKNRNSMFRNGFNPLYFCYPLLNSEEDRQSVIAAVTSDNMEIRKKFRAGSDSAPHYPENKFKIDGDGGVFTAPVAPEMYTQVFAEKGALGYLSDFFAINLMEDVYGITPYREHHTILVKEEKKVPKFCNGIHPFMAGEKLQWQIKS